MLSSSLLFVQATSLLSTVGHPVESVALRRGPERRISTATPLNTYATARWMLGISSTRRSPRSAEINLAGPPEDQSGRTELSSSVTTKACGNPRGSLKLLTFLQRHPPLATPQQAQLHP